MFWSALIFVTSNAGAPIIESEPYLGDFIRPRITAPYRLSEAVRRVTAMLATEKTLEQKRLEEEARQAKILQEKLEREAARQRVINAIAARKRVWDEVRAYELTIAFEV